MHYHIRPIDIRAYQCLAIQRRGFIIILDVIKNLLNLLLLKYIQANNLWRINAFKSCADGFPAVNFKNVSYLSPKKTACLTCASVE